MEKMPTPSRLGAKAEDASVCGTSEIETMRQTLKALEQSIEDKRVALETHAAEAERLNREWETLLQDHREVQQKLQQTGSMAGLILEGLRFDLDVLKHAFQRLFFRFESKASLTGGGANRKGADRHFGQS